MAFFHTAYLCDIVMILLEYSYRGNLVGGGCNWEQMPPPPPQISFFSFQPKNSFLTLSSKGANKIVEVFSKLLFLWSKDRQKRETCILRNAE